MSNAICAYIETQQSEVNMEAEIIAVYYRMSMAWKFNTTFGL